MENHTKPYRISDMDAEHMTAALIQIKNAIFSLCVTQHRCLERRCDFCGQLEDIAYQIEADLRKTMKNPISQAEADDLERFIAKVSL